MLRPFYDQSNIVIDLSDQIEKVVERERESHGFGREKLIAICATLRMLRSLKSSLSIAVLGPNSQWMSGLLIELTQLMGFSNVVSLVDPSVSQDSFVGSPHDFIVNMGCTEIENLKIICGILPKSSQISAYFISNYTDKVRHDAFVSRQSESLLLEKLEYSPIVTSYFASFVRGAGLKNRNSGRKVSPDLQKRCLFVVGHARSGSSLIFNLLNEITSILITYEMNLQIEKNRFDIISNFNNMNIKQRRPISKGFSLPTYPPPSAEIEDIFAIFLQVYELFGDKIAYGARDAFYNPHPADIVYDYLMEWFPFARFIITLREPRSAIAAMSRMRPSLSLELNIDFWLGGIIRMIDLLLVSDNSVVCFHSNVVSSEVAPIEKILDRTLSDALNIIDKKEVTTDDNATLAVWSNVDKYYMTMLEIISGYFEQLMTLIDPASGTLKTGYSRGELIRLRASFDIQYRSFLAKAAV